MHDTQSLVEPPRISAIDVRALFGHYDFRVAPDAHSAASDDSRVLLLYGDNGCGKTTVLRLAYHILAAETNAGHRTAIANVRFSRIALHLSDGSSVVVCRRGPPDPGGFEYVFGEADGSQHRAWVEARASDDGFVVRDSGNESTIRGIESRLDAMRLQLLFVPADRRVEWAGRGMRRLRGDAHGMSQAGTFDWEDAFRLHVAQFPGQTAHDTLKAALTNALDVMGNAVRGETLQIGTRAERSSNDTIADVLRSLARAGELPEVMTATLREDLIERLRTLERRAEEFASYGIAARYGQESAISVVREVSEDKLSIVANVLIPHIGAVERRLDALELTRDALRAFATHVTEMMRDKRATYNVRSGLRLHSTFGGEIELDALSSGEKQLILLLSLVMSMRQGRSLVIMDEPEISLNVKWQRMFVDGLLACARGASIQFILATHSIELIAEHARSVAPIRPVRSDRAAIETLPFTYDA